MYVGALGLTLSAIDPELPVYLIFDDGEFIKPGDPDRTQTVGKLLTSLQAVPALARVRLRYQQNGKAMRGNVIGVSLVIHTATETAQLVTVLHMDTPEPTEQLAIPTPCGIEWATALRGLPLVRGVHHCVITHSDECGGSCGEPIIHVCECGSTAAGRCGE